MPYITIKLMEGRSQEVKQTMVRDVTEAVATSLKIDPNHVRIELKELQEGSFAIAGQMAKKSK